MLLKRPLCDEIRRLCQNGNQQFPWVYRTEQVDLYSRAELLSPVAGVGGDNCPPDDIDSIWGHFGCHNLGAGTGICWVGARNAARSPAVHRKVPTTENAPAQVPTVRSLRSSLQEEAPDLTHGPVGPPSEKAPSRTCLETIL